MKKMFLTLFLLIYLSPAWSADLALETIQDEEEALENDIQPLESNTQNFSNLVHSTMDLLAPDLEMTQTTEMNAKAQTRPKY